MKLGAHVSAAGGLSKAIERAEAWDLEAAQIFVSSPQMWKPSSIAAAEIAKTAAAREKAALPLYIHAIYLINLGSDNPYYQTASVESLTNALEVGEQIGATGVITHLGSHKGSGFASVLPQVTKRLQTVLQKTSKLQINLFLENAAGSGSIIGANFADLGQILTEVGNEERLGICLDTAHAFASGYDVSTAAGLDETLAELEKACGLNKLGPIHLNDSKITFGGKRDRHEVIGQGLIGKDAFARIINHPTLAHRVGLLETPDLDPKAASVPSYELLKSLRKTV